MKLPFILTFLGLAGCINSVAAAPRPVIAVLGDSLAEGFGVETGKSFPDRLQGVLDKQGHDYRVVNLGISGDTTTGGLGRLQSVLKLQPAIVILELGGNDGLRGVPVTSTRANLDKMIEVLKKNGSAVLLAGMTLPPNYGSDYVSKFEGLYRTLAAKHKVVLIPFLMQDIVTRYVSTPNLMQRDGIHPTAAGQALIADTVYKYLKPMLKRQ